MKNVYTNSDVQIVTLIFAYPSATWKGVKTMKYSVTIEETLSRTVEIEADSKQDAIEKVKKQYNNESIVLDADDFSEVIFGVSYSTTEKEND